MSGSQVIITSPPDDGDGIVAGPTPRFQVQIIYTPGPDETELQIEHMTARLQHVADHIAGV